MREANREDGIEIDLQELFLVLLQKFWLIVLCGLAVGGITFLLSAFVLTPQYESTTKVYILNKSESSTLTYSDTQLATQLTKDYEELITCRYVLEKAIVQCGLEDTYEELCDRISVENTSDTRIIGITVKDPDAETARYIADSVRDIASEHIRTVMNIEAVNVVDEANLATKPSEPSVLLWTLAGVLSGIGGSALLLTGMYMMDDTIKSSEDIEKYLGLGTLALIPVMTGEVKNEEQASV